MRAIDCRQLTNYRPGNRRFNYPYLQTRDTTGVETVNFTLNTKQSIYVIPNDTPLDCRSVIVIPKWVKITLRFSPYLFTFTARNGYGIYVYMYTHMVSDEDWKNTQSFLPSRCILMAYKAHSGLDQVLWKYLPRICQWFQVAMLN